LKIFLEGVNKPIDENSSLTANFLSYILFLRITTSGVFYAQEIETGLCHTQTINRSSSSREGSRYSGRKFSREGCFNSPEAAKQFLACKLGPQEREVFAILLLDSGHRLIAYQEVFYGTIDAASVYPREIVKLVLETNSAAVIFAHNHPSGISDPSHADKMITRKLVDFGIGRCESAGSHCCG
jgi:DNA repair protein RadC